MTISYTLTVVPKVRFDCCDGETHIASKIRAMERHINKTGRHWIGPAEEFIPWAEKQMAGCLRNLASQIWAHKVGE